MSGLIVCLCTGCDGMLTDVPKGTKCQCILCEKNKDCVCVNSCEIKEMEEAPKEICNV